MPVYSNPDFRRLPQGPAALFEAAARHSFFALPGWYDLMARHGVAAATETRLYSDERPGSALALALQVATGQVATGPVVARPSERRLASLANAYSVEHGIVAAPAADIAEGLGAVLGEILGERPRWDAIALDELDARDPAYRATVSALRRAGLLVECRFHSGTWFEETRGMSFADYLAARPSELRNTWRRKRRRLMAGDRLKTMFYAGPAGIERAIADYQAIYARSWKPAEAFPDFIPALIRLAAEEGALRLGIASVDGIPAAAQFWIVWHGRAVIYKLAHDQRFDDLSLGTLLTMELIERVLAEDRPYEINFGRGDDPYKKSWLPRRRERWGIIAANPRTRRGLGLGLKREAAKLYHRVRGEPIAPPGLSG
jgi:Acetyltransferase (GNAT) domain